MQQRQRQGEIKSRDSERTAASHLDCILCNVKVSVVRRENGANVACLERVDGLTVYQEDVSVLVSGVVSIFELTCECIARNIVCRVRLHADICADMREARE